MEAEFFQEPTTT